VQVLGIWNLAFRSRRLFDLKKTRNSRYRLPSTTYQVPALVFLRAPALSAPSAVQSFDFSFTYSAVDCLWLFSRGEILLLVEAIAVPTR
jgi:hypothetical protein